MPRLIDPLKLDHAARLYSAGKTFAQAAAEIGHDPEAVRKALKRRGVESRPRPPVGGHNRIETNPQAVTDYCDGMSELAVSHKYGVSRSVVRRWLNDANAAVRNASEAGTLRMSNLSADERRQLAANAHSAVRGSTKTDEMKHRVALGRERSGYGGPQSPGRDRLVAWLTNRGIHCPTEKAVGPYNLDIALPESRIAVEVLGGNWHGAKAIHGQRTPYILDAGWHIIFVWDIQRCQVGPGALEYIVAQHEAARLNPTARREYRVIRGDGQPTARGRHDDDEFPLVPPSVTDLR